jgi:predicted nucleotidyltransferase
MAVATDTIVQDVRAALEPHTAVREVRLIGSQARGDAGPLSDWDFEVVTDDFETLARDIESLTAAMKPLMGQWDRLSPHMCYMLIVPGPVKIDFLFLDQPHKDEPPWEASAETLAGIDAHFWDWTIWLASKDAAGKHELVAGELRRMREHILGPMGVDDTPASVVTAIEAYTAARDRLETEFGTRVGRELGEAILGLLRKNGYDV